MAGSGKREVLLVESGGLDFDPDIQALYKGQLAGASQLPMDESRLRFLGGSSNHWDGHCRPLDPIDFETRSWVPHSGWPFNYQHLHPFYERAQVWWSENQKRWVGNDVPDFKADSAPGEHMGPFIMNPEGVARLFAPAMADGPFPEHYEPWESPVKNRLSGTQFNPAFKIWASEMDRRGEPVRYPIVATTYRLSEHMQAGAMTRNLPWLVELQPELFVEMSRELAAEKGIDNGDPVTVESARGRVRAVAVVTSRFKPFQVNGQVVHQIGLPWHWGYEGLAKGDSANVLTPHVGDANTMMPEYKAFLCDVRKGD